MSLTRQDAWSQDEDLLLAELVLKYIREGNTQLQAFEEVGRRLKRTAAACGFRWNSCVRKQYKSGIELSKKQRKARKQQSQQEEELMSNNAETEIINAEVPEVKLQEDAKMLDFEDLVHYLKTLYQKTETFGYQNEDIKTYEERIQTLEKQLYYLATENEKLTKELNKIEKDYNELVEIMEKAFKMVILKDEGKKQRV